MTAGAIICLAAERECWVAMDTPPQMTAGSRRVRSVAIIADVLVSCGAVQGSVFAALHLGERPQ